MKSLRVLLGLLAGITIGTVLGISFFARASTKRKIAKKGNEYSEELEEKFKELLGNITAKIEAVRVEALHLAENGNVKIKV